MLGDELGLRTERDEALHRRPAEPRGLVEVDVELGPNAPAYLAEVNDAFLAGFSVGSFAAGGVAAAGALFVSRFLPARA